jgi:hypothetical protein
MSTEVFECFEGEYLMSPFFWDVTLRRVPEEWIYVYVCWNLKMQFYWASFAGLLIQSLE